MKLPDLNLLVALDVLLDEQSVVAAAHRLNLSAPAMSRTLSRIREALGDPVLVRAGNRLVPTARAVELRDLVRKTTETALALLQPGSVDPLDDLRRQFTIRASDVFTAAYGGRLLRALRTRAPRCSLRLTAETDQDDEALREGRVDLWIGASSALDPETRVQTLFATTFLALAHELHPILNGEITPERFASYEHINISRRGVTSGPIDDQLLDLELRRTIAMIAPTYSSGLFALPNSDFIMPTPLHVAWALLPLAKGIRPFRIPLKLESFYVRQAWHPRLDNDAAHRWLRSLVAETCKEQPVGLLRMD